MLSVAIQPHDIWQKIEFWQRMLKEDIELELKLQKSRVLKKEVQSGTKVEGTQVLMTLYQMMKFNLDSKLVKRFAQVNAKIYSITGQQLNNIEVRID